MDFPNPAHPPLFLSTYTKFAPAWSVGLSGTAVGSSSTGFSTANLAFFFPMTLPFRFNVQRVFWGNGSSVTSVNHDFGIYTVDGDLIYSAGSTAAVGANAIQYVTPGTPFILQPGEYYFAVACNSATSNRAFAGSTSIGLAQLRMNGILQASSAFPLPSTMSGVSAAGITTTYYALCGITSTTSGF